MSTNPPTLPKVVKLKLAMASHPLDEVHPIVAHHKTPSSSPPQHQRQEANPRPRPEQALRCPRCDSTNTKFCYYNNYSFSQPRYFCKGCRRYWTKGGSLRNVPVGGGSRKNKRSSSTSTKKPVLHHDLQHFDKFSSSISMSSTSLLVPTMPFPKLSYEPSGAFLSFSSRQNDHFLIGNHNPNPNSRRSVEFLDILRFGVAGSTNASPAPDGGGFHGLYNGFGGGREELVGGRTNGVMLPFYEVGVSTLAAATVGHASTSRGSVGVDSAREEYWNAVGSSIALPHETIHDGTLS